MGYHVLPSMRLYWSSEPTFHIEAISKVMSLRRFLLILRFLHLNDNSQMPKRGEDNYDKLYKLRPMITFLQNKYQELFNPCRFLSIDESMVGFKGRSSLKQYCKNVKLLYVWHVLHLFIKANKNILFGFIFKKMWVYLIRYIVNIRISIFIIIKKGTSLHSLTD